MVLPSAQVVAESDMVRYHRAEQDNKNKLILWNKTKRKR